MWMDYLSRLPKRCGSGGSSGRCWNKGRSVCGGTGEQFYVREGVRRVKNKKAPTIVVPMEV
jgi:hypothetical protein